MFVYQQDVFLFFLYVDSGKLAHMCLSVCVREMCLAGPLLKMKPFHPVPGDKRNRGLGEEAKESYFRIQREQLPSAEQKSRAASLNRGASGRDAGISAASTRG